MVSRVLPALQTRACVSAYVKETRHTHSLSPALLWIHRLGGHKPGSGSHSPRDTAHLLAGSTEPPLQPPLRAEAAPWKLQWAARAAGHRGLTAIPQGITTGRGVFSKLREAEGPSPPPREDTTHRHRSTARPGAQEAVNKAELREAAGGTHLSGTRAAGASPGGPSRGHTCPVCPSAHRTSPRSLSRSLQTIQKATTEH